MSRVIEVKKLPPNPRNGTTYSITTTKSNKLTHNFFRFPCKYIPRIPEWAIERYGEEGKGILDPFAGSGTTLVESSYRGYVSYGVDFDPLSRLLIKTKTTPLNEIDIKCLKKAKEKILDSLPSNSRIEEFVPSLENIGHWFPERSIRDLSKIKAVIDEDGMSQRQTDVMYTALADIVKKVSYADPSSPKPYVPSNIEKNPCDVKEAYKKSLEDKLKRLKDYSENSKGPGAKIISEDARKIPRPKKDVSLVITSPPYINAFDYVRCLKLENMWLGFINFGEINRKKKEQIGHEKISSEQYTEKPKSTGVGEADKIIDRIYSKDKKRGHVVYEFFKDMRDNIKNIRDILPKGGKYVIVVGKNKIREQTVDTPEILSEVAKQEGFSKELSFSYVIKNKCLNMPRRGRGGNIDKDYVTVLKKN